MFLKGERPCLEANQALDSFKHYKFFLMVQNPSASNEYLSIFVPESYDTIVDNNIYPNCSLKVFVHSFSEESDNDDYTLASSLDRYYYPPLCRNFQAQR